MAGDLWHHFQMRSKQLNDKSECVLAVCKIFKKKVSVGFKDKWNHDLSLKQVNETAHLLKSQIAAHLMHMLKKCNDCSNLNENSHFAHSGIKEICKAFSLTLLRSCIIVHKLEILSKLAGFLSLFQYHPLRCQKKQTARKWKMEPFMGCLIQSELTFCSLSVFSTFRCYKRV